MLYELIPSMPEHRLLPLMSGSPKCCSAVGCSAGFCRRRNEGTDELDVQARRDRKVWSQPNLARLY
jgi:hypothetical protein